MANHTFTRPGGVWNSGSVLTAAECASFDAKSTDALSGKGGVYSITENLEIGGVPGTLVFITNELLLHTGTQATFKGPVFLNDDVVIGTAASDSLIVNSISDFNRTVDFHDNVGFHKDVVIGDGAGNVLDVNSGVDLRAGVTFWSDVVFNVDASLVLNCSSVFGRDGENDALVVYARASFRSTVFMRDGATIGEDTDDTLYIKASTSVQGPLTTSGDGRLVERHEQGVNGNATYTPREVRYVHVPAGGLSQNVNYTISDGGAIDGDRITFDSADDFTVNLKRPDGTHIIAMGPAPLSPAMRLVTVRRRNGAWQMDNDYLLRLA